MCLKSIKVSPTTSCQFHGKSTFTGYAWCLGFRGIEGTVEVAENYWQCGVLVHEKMKVCQQRYVMMGKSLKWFVFPLETAWFRVFARWCYANYYYCWNIEDVFGVVYLCFSGCSTKVQRSVWKKVHQEMKIGRYSPHVMTDGKISFKVSSSRSSEFSKPLFFCHEAWRMDFKENGNLIHFQAARLDPWSMVF